MSDFIDYFNVAAAVTLLPASGHLISNGNTIGAAAYAIVGLLTLFAYINKLHTKIYEQGNTISDLRETDTEEGYVDTLPVLQSAKSDGEIELEVQNP